MPICWYVGSMPISAVVTPMATMVHNRVFLRPTRSPQRPTRVPPSGRNRQAMAMIAYVPSTATVRSLSGKNAGAMMGAM